eukprot:8762656-Karenia_brevis.AAC.1
MLENEAKVRSQKARMKELQERERIRKERKRRGKETKEMERIDRTRGGRKEDGLGRRVGIQE